MVRERGRRQRLTNTRLVYNPDELYEIMTTPVTSTEKLQLFQEYFYSNDLSPNAVCGEFYLISNVIQFRDSDDIVNFLIDQGANLNVISDNDDTPLFYATIGTIDKMLSSEIDVEVKDSNGNTALSSLVDMYVDMINDAEGFENEIDEIHQKWLPIIEKLVQHGADVNISSKNGWTIRDYLNQLNNPNDPIIELFRT